MPYQQGQNTKIVGLRILENVDRILNKNGYGHCPKFLRQWLTAEAICAWVIGEFDDDPNLARETDFKKWWAAIQPDAVLSQSTPKAICSSAANLTKFITKSLNKEVGIDCHYVSGFARDFDTGSVPDNSNHSWVCFDFDGGIQVPADTVSHGDPKATRRKWKGKHLGSVVLTLTRESWEAFLSYHWGVVTCEDGKWEKFPVDKKDAFSNLNKSEWANLQLPLPSYLQLLNKCHSSPFGLPR